VKQESLYQRVGGIKTLRRLAGAFYSRVQRDALLHPLFLPKTSERQREQLALFLAEAFGGPKQFSTQHCGNRSLPAIHAHVPIDPANTAAWLRNMTAAMEEVGVAADAREAMQEFFFNHTPGPNSDPLEAPHFFSVAELKQKLERDPSLARQSRFGGMTLLHFAASAGDGKRARLLLSFGADVSARSFENGHTPLYYAINAGAMDVADLLLQCGADANVHSGPIQGTPLHVAARRDNVAAAKLLLAAGADIEARDIKGETPLRRALNCRQPGMIAWLIASGANLDAPDKRGVTPRQYAKKRGAKI
jgi:truncated hemoglobin YjbI